MNIYLKLFVSFLKIGAFSFGGGVAMLPLIMRETVFKNKWIEEGELLDIVAIAESTPGPIAINAATFIGHRTAGLRGAVCATLGVVLPSFVIIYAISFVLRQFETLRPVRYAFFGIRAGVCAMLVCAFLSLFGKSKKGVFECVIMAAAFAAVMLGVDPIIILAVCAALGIIAAVMRGRRAK